MPALSGHLTLRAAAGADGRTVLAHQSFCAPFHLGKAYWDGTALIVNVVNATAGILEGDTLNAEVGVEAGASVLLTSPAASRAFTTRGAGALDASCRQDYTVAAGGWLEVMGEPLVPHRASRYRQATRLSVEPGGKLYFTEVLAPGRAAHDEGWEWEALQIDLSLRLGGELIYHERTRQSGEELAAMAALAGMGKPWFATLLLVAEELDREEGWRRELHGLHRPGLRIGFSRLRPGAWIGRLIGDGPRALREALASIRERLQPLLPRLRADARKL